MKLFDRARKVLEAFTPAPLAPAQEYRILCRNGHRLRGDRTEGYQALRCQSCNELFFVLPKSPLPTPAGATAKFKPKPDHAPKSFEEDHALPRGHPSGDSVATVEPLPEGSQVDGEIDWVDDTTVTSSPETTSEDLPKAREPAKKRRNSAKPTAQRADPVVEVIPRERWVDWAKRKRNPLIFSAVMLLVLTTVWVRYRNARLAGLPQLIEIGRVEGLSALDAGDFDRAKALLSQAARAVHALGDESESGQTILQAAKEAALFTDLNLESLERLIDLARASEPTEWARTFKTLYRHRSILIDARIESVPEKGSSDPPTLDYIILAGNGPKPAARGRIDLTGFELLAGTSKKRGDGVLFGARLEDLALDPRSGSWRVKLVSDSGVFLRHPKALEAIGFATEITDDGEQ